jgi:hypothetical protein
MTMLRKIAIATLLVAAVGTGMAQSAQAANPFKVLNFVRLGVGGLNAAGKLSQYNHSRSYHSCH